MHRLKSALIFVSSALLLTIGVVATGFAGEPQFKEGVHYYVLPQPVRTSDPNRIEVAEIFWYGCSHCFRFRPVTEKWSKTLPDYVVYVRTPAVWQPRMELHARAFYTARALKVIDSMHEQLFDAMNVRRKRLANEREIAEVFEKAGIDHDTFSSTFNSFGIISQSRQAEANSKAYRITGTPAMIVNGKYRISGESAGSNEGMLKVVEFLVEKEHNEVSKGN